VDNWCVDGSNKVDVLPAIVLRRFWNGGRCIRVGRRSSVDSKPDGHKRCNHLCLATRSNTPELLSPGLADLETKTAIVEPGDAH
jgi:hypothetical protein